LQLLPGLRPCLRAGSDRLVSSSHSSFGGDDIPRSVLRYRLGWSSSGCCCRSGWPSNGCHCGKPNSRCSCGQGSDCDNSSRFCDRQRSCRIRSCGPLNRPGANITGISFLSIALGSKRLEFLREVVPKVSSVALLVNPSNSNAKPQIDDTRQAASTLGVQVDVLSASSSDDINAAFATLVRQRAGGLVVSADPFFISQREQLITLAAQHAVPAIYYTRESTEDGGLMSYGSNFAEAHRQAGNYIGRILKGEKPGDLPLIFVRKV
jgi:hypothetical protein